MTRKQANNSVAKDKVDASAPKKRTGPFEYVQQVQQEAKKVTWTTPAELRASLILVLIMTTIAMLFFWGVDSALQWIIRSLLSLGGGQG